MRLGIDPKVDYAFQKVFGSEENAALLIDLLTAVVRPARPITGVEIVRPHSDRERPDDKQVIGDVKARDQGGRQFHLEMQWQVPWYFPKRALFYWGKFHAQQLRQGENYLTLRPTVLVCFLNQTLFADVAAHHLVFRLREEASGRPFSDDLEVHLVELPKFTKSADELTDALDRWCYFLRHGEGLDVDRLPAALDVPVIRRAMEVLTVWTQEEREREAYELRLKFQLDQASFQEDARQSIERALKEGMEKGLEEGMEQGLEKGMEQGLEKGMEQGLEKGLEQGLEKGTVLGQIQLLQELLKQPQTPAAELAALSQDALAALLAQLRQRLSANGA